MGPKVATQKIGKNAPWPKAARPEPRGPKAIQDNIKGAKKIENRRAPNAEKQSTRAPEPKFERKTPSENARFPQMLENKALEHPKWSPNKY